ncbi:ATP-binding protein, partial [Kitasatospora sp. NPDC093806]|uniref:ATP-binding protein n=1 Tax=Kitasatospora sp. NPDC093806 TaxID=3155075 RepID=UPI00343D1183
MDTHGHTTLYGRDQEKRMLDGLVDRARRHQGSALVIWGEPGIGTTAMLEYPTAGAADFTLIRCRGSRSESALGFAALHELLWPLADRVPALPPPQAAALGAVLGHCARTGDRFLVGAAVLTLLSRLAAERPLLVLVDGADELDRPTAQCLAFVARRLRTERVLLLLAAHTAPAADGPWEALPALALAPLGDEDAARLARAAAPGADEATVRRTVGFAAGNPLALRELPSRWADPNEPRAFSTRLRRAVGSRTAGLSPAARALLLLAAAEQHGNQDHGSQDHGGQGCGDEGRGGEEGDEALVRRTAGRLGLGPGAWDEVLRPGLLAVGDGRTRFHAPLVAALLYEEAAPAERRAAHRALAQALPVDGAPEGARVWHLAHACDGPDEALAAALERGARTAAARGRCDPAVRALRRAAELSPGAARARVRAPARARVAAVAAGRSPSASSSTSR